MSCFSATLTLLGFWALYDLGPLTMQAAQCFFASSHMQQPEYTAMQFNINHFLQDEAMTHVNLKWRKQLSHHARNCRSSISLKKQYFETMHLRSYLKKMDVPSRWSDYWVIQELDILSICLLLNSKLWNLAAIEALHFWSCNVPGRSCELGVSACLCKGSAKTNMRRQSFDTNSSCDEKSWK